jgi:hypothetical protein
MKLRRTRRRRRRLNEEDSLRHVGILDEMLREETSRDFYKLIGNIKMGLELLCQDVDCIKWPRTKQEYDLL